MSDDGLIDRIMQSVALMTSEERADIYRPGVGRRAVQDVRYSVNRVSVDVFLQVLFGNA